MLTIHFGIRANEFPTFVQQYMRNMPEDTVVPYHSFEKWNASDELLVENNLTIEEIAASDIPMHVRITSMTPFVICEKLVNVFGNLFMVESDDETMAGVKLYVTDDSEHYEYIELRFPN
jgi:hypothetical protein